MVGILRCYVPFCGHNKRKTECTFFRFPLNPSRCKQWVKRVGTEDFAYQTVEMLHKLRFVCSCHFEEKDFCSKLKKRLNNVAVPSILDSRIQELPDEIISNFPITGAHVVPVTSFHIKIPAEDLENMHKYKKVQKKNKEGIKEKNNELPVVIPQQEETVLDLPEISIFNEQTSEDEMKDEMDLEHRTKKPYRLSVSSKRTSLKKLLEDAGIPGVQMTPEVKLILRLLLAERRANQKMKKELRRYIFLIEALEGKLDKITENITFSK